MDPGIGGDDSVVIGGALPRGAFRLAATLAVQHARVACLLAVDRVPRVDVLGFRQDVERCRAVRCLTADHSCGCPHVEIPSTCGCPLLVACMKSSVCRALLFDVSSCCQRPSLKPYRATSATASPPPPPVSVFWTTRAPGVDRLRSVRAVGAASKRRGPPRND